jgi:hypothetical protein
MVVGPAKAGPICFSADSALDGAPKVLHGAAAEHAVAGLTELFPERGRNLFPSDHVLPGVDVFVARGEEVGLRRVVKIQIPAATHKSSSFRDQRHAREIRISEREKDAVLGTDVLRGASLEIRAWIHGVVGHEDFPSM